MSPSTIYHQNQNQDLQQQQQQQQHSSSSPLKIKKDSHFIQKSSSSSSSSSVASSSALSAIPKHHQPQPQPQPQKQQQQQQRHPVIIYTHSPRVIHTKARDFMALVQKLTGLENDQSAVQPNTSGGAKSVLDGNGNLNNNKKKLGSGRTNHDDNDSSSVVTGDEKCGSGNGVGGLLIKDVDQVIGTNSIPTHPNPNPYNMIDLPIFTPNSTTDSFYYSSSRPSFYTFPNPVISFANYMGNYNASPSFHHHQVIKGGAKEDY